MSIKQISAATIAVQALFHKLNNLPDPDDDFNAPADDYMKNQNAYGDACSLVEIQLEKLQGVDFYEVLGGSNNEEDIENAKSALRLLVNELGSMEGCTFSPHDNDMMELLGAAEGQFEQFQKHVKSALNAKDFNPDELAA